MTNEIDDLINRARELSRKPTKKGRHENDIFIYQNRPVHSTDWSRERDVTFIGIYMPSKLPDISIPHNSIVLHKHTVFDSCDRNRYCHIFGWDVPDVHRADFDYIWSFLYNPSPARHLQLGVDLSL